VRGGDFLIGYMEFAERDSDGAAAHRLSPMEDPSRKLVYMQRCGLLAFAALCRSEEQARNIYGDTLESRVPNHSEFEHPCGCVHRDYAELARSGTPWIEIALRTALKYAERAVVVVAPVGLSIASRMLEIARDTGKQLINVPLSAFSRGDLKKLTTTYYYKTEGEPDADAERAFSIIMRSYWE